MTTLADLLSRLSQYQEVNKKISQTRQVYFIDDAIRMSERKIDPPWLLKKASMRVFEDVITYPLPTDYYQIAYMDKQPNNPFLTFDRRARFRFTSLSEFFEDVDNRNTLGEVWNNGVITLGVRYFPTLPGFVLLNNAETLSDWTLSGDAISDAIDYVNFIEGAASLRVNVVKNTNIAGIKGAITLNLYDPLYKQKYFFVWVSLNSVPTSVDLQAGTDVSNYLTANVTSQFDGSPFVANDWNLLAFDCNTATTVGTFTGTFSFQNILINGVTTGFYYVDASYLRQWQALDYWYYSKNNVTTITGAEQQYFVDNNAYSTDSSLKGDDLWSDLILYQALSNMLDERENEQQFTKVADKLTKIWEQMSSRYPDLAPTINTTKYRFGSDYRYIPRWYDSNN